MEVETLLNLSITVCVSTQHSKVQTSGAPVSFPAAAGEDDRRQGRMSTRAPPRGFNKMISCCLLRGSVLIENAERATINNNELWPSLDDEV